MMQTNYSDANELYFYFNSAKMLHEEQQLRGSSSKHKAYPNKLSFKVTYFPSSVSGL